MTEDIIYKQKDGTQRLVKSDDLRYDQIYGESGEIYVIYYKNFPVYVEVLRLVLSEEDWKIHICGQIGLIDIDTARIKVQNDKYRWYKFWEPKYINYTYKIPFDLCKK